MGVSVSAASRTTACTSAVVRGMTTTSGTRCARKDQNDASKAYGYRLAASSMMRSAGIASRRRPTSVAVSRTR